MNSRFSIPLFERNIATVGEIKKFYGQYSSLVQVISIHPDYGDEFKRLQSLSIFYYPRRSLLEASVSLKLSSTILLRKPVYEYDVAFDSCIESHISDDTEIYIKGTFFVTKKSYYGNKVIIYIIADLKNKMVHNPYKIRFIDNFETGLHEDYFDKGISKININLADSCDVSMDDNCMFNNSTIVLLNYIFNGDSYLTRFPKIHKALSITDDPIFTSDKGVQCLSDKSHMIDPIGFYITQYTDKDGTMKEDLNFVCRDVYYKTM